MLIRCWPRGHRCLSWLTLSSVMLSLVTAGLAVEGLLSAVILNIVVGLITSLISGASVWAWGRARVTRRQRERARCS